MRYLVTGASGWVGMALIRELRHSEPTVSLLALVPPQAKHDIEAARLCELRSMEGVEVLEADLLTVPPDFFQESFQKVFHLAAHTATECPGEAMRTNDRGTLNLIKALGDRLTGTPVLYTGSIASLDDFESGSSGVSERVVPRPITAYGKSKLMGEAHLVNAAKRLGFPLHIVRAANVIGPGGFRPGGLFDVVTRSLARRGMFVRIDWPGAISVIDVRDFARAMCNLVAQELQGHSRILHVAHPVPVSLSRMIDQADGRRPAVVPIPFRTLLVRGFRMIAAGRLFPEGLRILCWRVCHLCSRSMVMDTSCFQTALPDFELRDPDQSLKETYAGAR